MNSILKQPESETSSQATDVNANSIYQMRRPGLQGCSSGSPCKTRLESPKRLPLPHQFIDKQDEGRNTPDSHLKHENEKLRIALQQRFHIFEFVYMMNTSADFGSFLCCIRICIYIYIYFPIQLGEC